MRRLICSVLLLTAVTAPAFANGPSGTPFYSLTSAENGNVVNGVWILGWSFTVNSPISVIALGVRDPLLPPSLPGTQQVGLWDSSGNLLASTDVDNSDTVVGVEFYRAITPVALSQGQTYVLGYRGDEGFRYQAVIATVPEISYVGSRLLSDPGSLVFPGIGPDSAGYFGPNALFTTAASPAEVSGTKTAAGTFSQGGTVTYTVVLTNNGAGAQGDNPGNEFVDVLPPTLALGSANATSGTAVATVGTNTVTWNGTIAPAGSVTITITATILPAPIGTSVSNQGTINFDGDANGTNETAALTDDPAAGGAGNATTILVTGSVPALSPAALVLLCALLAMVAVVRSARFM